MRSLDTVGKTKAWPRAAHRTAVQKHNKQSSRTFAEQSTVKEGEQQQQTNNKPLNKSHKKRKRHWFKRARQPGSRDFAKGACFAMRVRRTTTTPRLSELFLHADSPLLPESLRVSRSIQKRTVKCQSANHRGAEEMATTPSTNPW